METNVCKPSSLIGRSWNNSSCCEADLQAVMLSVDRVVMERKEEWGNEVKKLEERLRKKDEHMKDLQETLASCQKEMQLLKQELESTRGAHLVEKSANEDKLIVLRQEVKELQLQYSRLQKKYCKQLRQLEQKCENYEKLLTEQEVLRFSLQAESKAQLEMERQHVQEVTQQRDQLQEKLQTLQTQTKGFEIQLETLQRLLADNEAQKEQFELQLREHRDKWEQQSREVQEVNNTLLSTTRQYNDLFTEHNLLQNQLEQARNVIVRLESEVNQVRAQRERREKQVQCIRVQLRDIQERLRQRESVPVVTTMCHAQRCCCCGDNEKVNQQPQQDTAPRPVPETLTRLTEDHLPDHCDKLETKVRTVDRERLGQFAMSEHSLVLTTPFPPSQHKVLPSELSSVPLKVAMVAMDQLPRRVVPITRSVLPDPKELEKRIEAQIQSLKQKVQVLQCKSVPQTAV